LKTKKVEKKQKWVKPRLTLYGNMATLTQQQQKLKSLGFGDDFSSNISTVGG
jgi:hypothetical protein